jgi:Monooxygenase af470-like
MPEPRPDETYIAALWEHPQLCVSLFGAQFHTPEGERLYAEAGIQPEVESALTAAREEGLLLVRQLMSPEGPLLMLYWRSYEELDRWARKLPHTRWWRWLIENVGQGVGFYHEIYQVKTAEAIYERGTRPVGPALFCSTETVPTGEGRSRQRQQRFADAAEEPS